MRKFVMKLWGGIFQREASYPNDPGSEMVDWVLTVNLIQNGATVTGTFQGGFTSSCCQGTVATPVNETVNENNVASLSWPRAEGQCDGPVCSFRGVIGGGELMPG